MKVALAFLALAALVASAHATCYCNQLKYIVGSSCPATTPAGTAPTGYTYTAVNPPTNPSGGTCYILYDDDTESISSIAAGCTGACKGFSIYYASVNVGTVRRPDYEDRLKYCYFTGTLPVSTTPATDKRCFGVYTKIFPSPPPPPPPPFSPPPPPPRSPPPPPPLVGDPFACCEKYTGGARDKCIDCIRTSNTNKATPAQCCSCPVTTRTDTTNCIDCVVTAYVADKGNCSLCLNSYPDINNGYIRCLECVKLAKARPALNPASWFPSQADQCLYFCSAKHLPDPTECLDCTKDSLAANFMLPVDNLGRITNYNGQCPSSGRKQL